ncbi:HAMP domain-containing sensor histidine kinase [Paraburkholderia sp. J12]|uniref:sensor histidine kinase n=1 Tax=Paraburkholderia sp. J12 TaxID=2805432 RepID=UPI002ABE0D52|nr:HAMP domain-containing sensor histidine kinase [Paraburkholderia sp. J12]
MSLPGWAVGKTGEFVLPSPRAATAPDPTSATRDIAHDRWQTTTFRWFAAYAAIFSISFMALLGVIEFSVTHAMERETDSGLRWQLRYFDSRSDNAVAGAIDARLKREDRGQNAYGLFDGAGHWLAGNIHSLPEGLELGGHGRTYEHKSGQSLVVDVVDVGDVVDTRPTLRVMGEVRANGSVLVVARLLSDVRRVHDELMKAIFGGGLLCLAASLCAGLVLSMRQIRRVAEIRRVTARIASGDLDQRLPVTGRDELDMLSHLVNRMLDEVERLMGEVKSACDGIAHDLRTPLTRLRLRLSTAADAMERRGESGVAQVLVGARDEADSVLDRFAALLRISEIGAMQRRSGFASLSLPDLVNELCDLYGPLAEEKSITLVASIAPAALIHADRALLFEAFSNLLDNAIKFAPEGGRVEVALRAGTGGPQFAVADNGPGIAPDERSAVLGRYYRSERTRHLPGTGLGLGIVSAIVRLHDFDLSIGAAHEGTHTGTAVTIDCWPHHT